MRNRFTGGVIILLLVAVGYGLWHGRTVSQWETRVESALEDARTAEAQAEVFGHLAEVHEARATAFAASAAEQAQVVRERVVEVREVEVPAPCVSLVAVRDTIIDTSIVVVDRQAEAIVEYVAVAEFLRQRSMLFQMRGDSLEAVLIDRPGPKAWWMPETGVGGFVGVCAGGGVCSGVGITFSWSIP